MFKVVFKTEEEVSTIAGKFRCVFRAERTRWTVWGYLHPVSTALPPTHLPVQPQNIIKGIFKLSVLKR